MKQFILKYPVALPHRRLTGAVVLVIALLALRSYLSPKQNSLETREGAERLAAELPAITQVDVDPRKSFANNLGKILTSGMEIAGTRVTVLTWGDVDRSHLKLLGAVLNIPTNYFSGHPSFAGCDQISYINGQCRFDLDFSSGNLQIINTQPSVAHNYKTSEVGNGSALHL